MFEHSRASWIVYVVAAALVMAAGLRIFGGDERGSPPVTVSGPGVDAAVVGSGDGTAGLETDPRAGEPAAAGVSGGPEITIHVAGAVRNPGVYVLNPGARADAAVEEAGGFAPAADRTAVNLATTLEDGQQVLVPKQDGAGTAATASAAGDGSGTGSGAAPAPGSSTGQKVSLAGATAEQLDAAVEGFGPTLSARIVEFRDQNGVTAVEGLREVPGIGDVRYQALAEALVP